jgi:F0F1-type ATP synthase assembly protein I
MKNQEIKLFSKKVIVANLIILVLASIVLLILKKYSWLIGYIIGSVTSYITYFMHVNHAIKFSENSGAKQSLSASVLRTLVSAIALLIAFFVDFIDIFATFIGLLIIKFSIFIIGFCFKNKKEGMGE